MFKFGSDIMEVVVDDTNLIFLNSEGTASTIQGLKIQREGVIKEFPDLKDNENWKEEAIKRFKKYIKKMKTMDERIEYVKDELTKFGYDALYKQRAGHRPQKFR